MKGKTKSLAILILVFMAFAIALAVPETPQNAFASTSPPYIVTVSFKDADGNSIANNKQYKTDANGKYSLSIVTITGYTFKTSTLPLADRVSENIEITMIYEPIKLQVKVIYVDTEGVAIKGAPNKTYTITLYDYLQLDLTEVKIEGYKYVGDKEIIPVTAVGNITVKLTYAKEEKEGCGSTVGLDASFYAVVVCLMAMGLFIKGRRAKKC